MCCRKYTEGGSRSKWIRACNTASTMGKSQCHRKHGMPCEFIKIDEKLYVGFKDLGFYSCGIISINNLYIYSDGSSINFLKINNYA